jgi:hypothetical protein
MAFYKEYAINSNEILLLNLYILFGTYLLYITLLLAIMADPFQSVKNKITLPRKVNIR